MLPKMTITLFTGQRGSAPDAVATSLHVDRLVLA